MLFFSLLFIVFEISNASNFSTQAQLAPLFENKQVNDLKNRYIIVFKDATGDGRRKAIDSLLMARDGITEIHHEYSLINGIAATISDSSLKMIRENKDVKFIEQDAIMTAYADECIEQQKAEWCLARISNVKIDQKDYLYPDKAGKGVTIYVIDTGVNVKHSEFEGRAKWGANYVRTEPAEDLNGHGTGVASLVAGAKAGVAKLANIRAIKVLNSRGSGTISDIIAGINYAANQADIGVINLSLGGGFSRASNDAVNKASDKGHVVVVAAGNEAQDACNVSPASAEKAVTVAASDDRNYLARFSNYGRCINVIAPGVNCYQADLSNNKFKSASGTSFSSPLTAGVVALLKSKNPDATASDLINLLLASAVQDEIQNVKGSDNVFIQSKCA